MTRARHLGHLLKDLTAYAVVNRAVWLIPLMLVLLLLMAAIVVGEAVAPFSIYPLF